MPGEFARYSFLADIGDGVSAVVTLAAAARTTHFVRRVIASYDLFPTTDVNAVLTIAWTLAGTAKTLTVGMNPQQMDLDFGDEIQGDVGTGITITLTAAGASPNRSLLNVFYRSQVN